MARIEPLPVWRLIACIFLPFAAGYYLAYLFRTINTLIAGPLGSDLGLGAADIGLLTSIYFLVVMAGQIPIGMLLDRYGPRGSRACSWLWQQRGPRSSDYRRVSFRFSSPAR